LARWLLALGIVATLAANVAHGWSDGPVGAVVAAWPAASLVGSYELLLWLIRTSAAVARGQSLAQDGDPAAHPATDLQFLPVTAVGANGSRSVLGDSEATGAPDGRCAAVGADLERIGVPRRPVPEGAHQSADQQEADWSAPEPPVRTGEGDGEVDTAAVAARPYYGLELAEKPHLHTPTYDRRPRAAPEQPHDRAEVRPQRHGSPASGPRRTLFSAPRAWREEITMIEARHLTKRYGNADGVSSGRLDPNPPQGSSPARHSARSSRTTAHPPPQPDPQPRRPPPMAHIHTAARPAARPAAWRPLRAPRALALALAAPATSLLPALTTGLRGTGTAISFPHGFVTALTGGTP
jgi:hypothetical protein